MKAKAKKKKILVVSDGAVCPTGFGDVSEEILDRLHETGEWEIHQLGINYFDTPHDKPYKIYMASAGEKYDWLGVTRLKELYDQLQPDVVWLFQDFWHIAKYIQTSPNMRGLCLYYPVDSPNIKSNWSIYFTSAVEVATYTRFAAEETAKSLHHALKNLLIVATEQGKEKLDKIKLHTKDNSGILLPANRIKYLADPNNISIISHGVDRNKFYPINKKEAREKLGFEQDWYIVANINRNQPRKRLDLTIKAFAEFSKDKDNARLLLHDPLPSIHEGWDIIQLATERYGVGDKILLSGKNQRGNYLSIEELNNLHNCVDVMLNTGGGEGFGLNSSASACCKVPQIVPNWSATGEIWKDSGILLDIVSTTHQPVINTEHCVIDTDHLVRELDKLYESPELAKEIGEKCYLAMQRPEHDWDNVANAFIEMFNRAAKNKYNYDDSEIDVQSSLLEL